MYLYTTVLASLLYASSGYFMKKSEGMSQLVPTLALFALIGLAALQTLALQNSSLTKTYVW